MAVKYDRPLVTEGQVDGWLKRKDELEKALSSTHQELADINRKLEAVAVLRSESPASSQTVETAQIESSEPSESMMAAVERIAQQSPHPMTKKQVKRQLKKAGFPEISLGNYFYTVIMRLKGRERITVHGDGRVSGPRPSTENSNGNARHAL